MARRRQPPETNIVEFQRLKAAAGGSGSSGGGSGYSPGQNMICKVLNSRPGGYEVIIVRDNLKGFLPTEHLLKPGESVLAQFVCVHNNQIIVSARFGKISADESEDPSHQ